MGQGNVTKIIAKCIETETFQSFVDKKVYKINPRFTCSDNCMVYLLSYKVCSMQYNGQTNDEFRHRWKNYKDNNQKSLRGEDHKQADFLPHFQRADHSGFINNTEIIFVDKTDPSDSTRGEDFWTNTLKTRYPQGLNNIDPYHWCIYGICLFLFFKNFFFYEIIIYRLFLFPISPLVRQVTMLSPSEVFFRPLTCSVVFIYA